jgi:lysophospholipase L1-like esterase
MTETRVVTGTILDPLGNPWKDFPIVFTLTPSTYTDDATLPTKAVRVYTDELGQFTTELITGVEYQVLYSSISRTSKDQTLYTIVVPSGNTPITLQELQVGSFTPNTPDILSLVDQKLVSVQTDIEDLDSRLDSLDADLGDTVSRINSSLKPDGTLKDTVVTRAALDANVAAAVTPRGGLLSALGDSITAGSGGLSAGTGYYWFLSIISGGRVRYAGFTGYPGNTSAQILTHVPDVLSQTPKPQWCIVLAGTNDVGQNVALGTTIANLRAIYDQLLAGGVTPVPATIPPQSGIKKVEVARVNAAIQSLAALYALPCIDFHRVLSVPETGDYVVGLGGQPGDADVIHPSPKGHVVMATEAWRILEPIWTAPRPYLTTYKDDPLNMVANGLFIGDANSDGLADSWGQYGDASSGTFSLEAGTNGVRGNWQKLTAPNGRSNIRVLAPTLKAGTFDSGDVLEVSTRIKTTGLSDTTGSGPGFNLPLRNQANQGFGIINFFRLQGNLEGVWTVRGVVPAGSTGGGFHIAISDTSGQGTIALAEFTVINLTKLGIA